MIRDDAVLEVTDLQGKKVLSVNIDHHSRDLKIESLSNGFYIMNIKENGHIKGRTTFVKHGID